MQIANGFNDFSQAHSSISSLFFRPNPPALFYSNFCRALHKIDISPEKMKIHVISVFITQISTDSAHLHLHIIYLVTCVKNI